VLAGNFSTGAFGTLTAHRVCIMLQVPTRPVAFDLISACIPVHGGDGKLTAKG